MSKGSTHFVICKLFQVAVNKSGVIQTCNYDMYEDNGFMLNETMHIFAADAYYNCYDNNRWNFKGFNTRTDNAKNTFCRSPGKYKQYTKM